MFKGHPRGLAQLFFTEMWERLGFYLIVGVLATYAMDVERGGLGMAPADANTIYGTYMAFVYFTPFLGGIIADKFLGYRRSVLLGGILFVLGYFLLGIPDNRAFYGGLVSLCLGNGLFKPNVSAMVGNLYPAGDKMRDAGFNLFYMGINIGAATANLVAAPMRNAFGWSWAFWAAAIGNAIGLLVLISNWKLLGATERQDRTPEKDEMTFGQIFAKILLPAFVTGIAGYLVAKNITWLPIGPSVFGFLLGMFPVFYFFWNLSRTAPEHERAGLSAVLPIFLAGGTFFMILHMNGSALTNWAKEKTDREVAWIPEPMLLKQEALTAYYSNAPESVARPDPNTLLVVDKSVADAFGAKKLAESMVASLDALPDVDVETGWRDGATLPNVAKRSDALTSWVFKDSDFADGKPTPTAKAVAKVAFLRKAGENSFAILPVTQAQFDGTYAKATAATPRLPPGEFLNVVNPEVYQSWNGIFVVLLTPLVIPFFGLLTRRGREITTARKLFYGLLLTAAAMLVMFIAGVLTDNGTTKVAGLWLVITYLILTIGELCLSPIGLSLVTKLSPKRLVGMMMGGWFCATAFGNKLTGLLGTLEKSMLPTHFFLMLVGAVLLVAFFIRMQLPRLEATLKQYKA